LHSSSAAWKTRSSFQTLKLRQFWAHMRDTQSSLSSGIISKFTTRSKTKSRMKTTKKNWTKRR
jgi:hypothetical protein